MVRNELIWGFETNTIDSYDPSRLCEHHKKCGFAFERRPCARRVRPMPHNPEAGSASQKEAIEEPIDPPFSGRLIAAFFRSKQRDKKKKFFIKTQKIKKEKNYKRTKKLSIYQKFFNSFIFNSFLIFFFFLSSLLLDHLKISHRPRVRSKTTGSRAIFV